MENKEKRIKIISVLIILISIIFMIYGAAVLLCIGTGHWFNFAFVIVGMGMLVFAVLLKWLCRHKFLFTIIIVFLAAALIFTSIMLCRIISFKNNKPAENPDYIIVLGAKTQNGQPKKEFATRIRTAAEYAKKYPDAKIITTGGKDEFEYVSEAESAESYLISLGISADRILTERRSSTTDENLNFAAEVIKENAGDAASAKTVIVSSNFHLYRASILAGKYGYGNTSYLGCNGLFLLIPHYYLREVAAYVKMQLFGMGEI